MHLCSKASEGASCTTLKHCRTVYLSLNRCKPNDPSPTFKFALSRRLERTYLNRCTRGVRCQPPAVTACPLHGLLNVTGLHLTLPAKRTGSLVRGFSTAHKDNSAGKTPAERISVPFRSRSKLLGTSLAVQGTLLDTMDAPGGPCMVHRHGAAHGFKGRVACLHFYRHSKACCPWSL
jgi:hypothetical protein